MSLETDLEKCSQIMGSSWPKQSREKDFRTNFIYKCYTLDDCLEAIEINNALDLKDYALHRWYNKTCSIICEYMFCDYGAIHETDIYNHDTDIYIDGIPFDVKLTVYPKQLLNNKLLDITSRQGKNKLLQWLYANQSKENRKQFTNRLYIVCKGHTYLESINLKNNFPKIRQKVYKFMEYYNQHKTINTITVQDGEQQYIVQSDIIAVFP